jgi:Mg-chelatase subunit ChlD
MRAWLIAAFFLALCAQASSGAEPVRIGPLYTAAAANHDLPAFPEVQILVEFPLSDAKDPLSPNAFRLRVDDGETSVATRVQPLAEASHGMAVVVLLDVSGSMQGAPLNAVRKGLAQFAGDAGPQDRIAIETIADDTRLESNWGDSPQRIQQVIAGLAARGKLTRLWDGLAASVRRFPDLPVARRAIVISDGHDEGSSQTLENAIADARKAETPVDAIGITRSNRIYLATLRRLAAETGGQFRQARNMEELERLTASGIGRLKSLPVVDFTAKGVSADGKKHRFEVIWSGGGAESTASISWIVPFHNAEPIFERFPVWMLASALALAALLTAVIAFALRRRVSRRPNPPQPTPAPASARNFTPIHSEPARAAPPAPVALRSPVPSRPAERLASPSAPRPQTQLAATFAEPAPDRPCAWLIAELGPAAGKSFPINAPQYWIGADPSNQLQILGDATISGHHACIVFDHDVLGIFDYHSTNGTRVNGESVRDARRLLRPGDRIRVGASTLIVARTATAEWTSDPAAGFAQTFL